MHENFCCAPFTQLLAQPTGLITPCCWNQDIILGNINKNSIEEIWNGEKIQKFRQEFLDNNIVSCKKHIAEIGCHKNFKKFESKIEYAKIVKSGPQRLDLRLNGKCNLRCIMCDVWQQPNDLFTEEKFWKYAREHIFPSIKEIDVLGGEPFIQKDTYKLIDEVSKVNPNCTWAFVTNGNYKMNKKILSTLDKIKIRWIQVSLDSLDDKKFSEIRLDGNLQTVLNTIETLQKYRVKRILKSYFRLNSYFRLTSSFCVLESNWKEVPQFLKFCKRKRIVPILQFAYIPLEHSLLKLNREQKIEISNYLIQNVKGKLKAYLSPILEPLKS